MNARIAAVIGALSLALAACPGPTDPGGVDAGTDASVPNPGGCTGGCGPDQKCDEAQRKCVDMCDNACGAGMTCVELSEDNWGCSTPLPTECAGVTCGAGQTACIADTCSCMPFTETSIDTCASVGRVCRASWNSGTQTGGLCENPDLYERCIPRGSCPEGQDCGTCGTGRQCAPVFLGAGAGICVRSCGGVLGGGGECGPDELCSQQGCLPRSVFLPQRPEGMGEGSYDCQIAVPAADGGFEQLPDGGMLLAKANVTHPCLKIADDGTAAAGEDPANPSGTCAQVLLRDQDQLIPISYCRTNGTVPEFGTCKTTPIHTKSAEVCSAGLECVATGIGDDGVCMRMCNAVPNGGGPTCQSAEACVNLYGLSSSQAILGTCMTECNVFSKDANYGCGTYGAMGSACVPTTPEQSEQISPNGDGVCVPVTAATATEGQPCSDNDVVGGAACTSGLICTRTGQTSTCVKPCDLECDGTDEPARCATEANAKCGAGKTCSRVSDRTGAFLGVCL